MNSRTRNAAAGTATLSATGIAYPDWNKVDDRFKSVVDRAVSDITFDPDRARAAWAAIPVATGDGYHYHTVTRIHLPDGGKGFTLEGDRTVAQPIVGVTIARTVTENNGWLTIDDRSISTGGEGAATDIAAARTRIAAAKGHLLTAVAPADLPPLYQRVDATKRAKGFASTLALYAAGIADAPDEATPYTSRAWFLEKIYERGQAIDDLTRAIAIKPDVDTYQWRARLYEVTGAKDKALADLLAAQKLDPSSDATLERLASLQIDRGEKAAALAMIQERIDQGGKAKPQMMALMAEMQGRVGDKDGALATIDRAVAASPGNAGLLNSRCWLKGTLNVALDTALRDCTRSIELSESTSAALDSPAQVYFRTNRRDDAKADLTAVLDEAPDQAASLYMRGVIREKQGNAAAKTDLAAARTISPRIDEDYKRYGIVP